VANLAEAFVVCGANQRGKKSECIRATTIAQRAIFHFSGKHFGMFGERISGAAHGFAGEYKLHFIRKKFPIGGLHGFGPFTQPFWHVQGVINAMTDL
jgi:hypothetical protein